MSTALTLALLLIGCKDGAATDDTQDTQDTQDSGDGLAPPEGDAETVELAGECPLASHIGEFSISEFEDYSIIDGAVADSVVPLTVLEEVAREGDCWLLLKNNPFCDPGCGGDEVCDFDGTCLPYPTAMDLGKVSVAGLDVEVIMDPIQPGFHYFDTAIPHPVFGDGQLLQLRADGGVYGAFDLHGVGVTPLEHDGEELVIERGQDLLVSWTASEGRASVFMKLSIDQHGASPMTLVCDFEDDGQGVAPAALVDKLVEGGVTGYPNSSLSRRTVDRVDVSDGCVDLVTQSRRNPDVRVEGFTPCNGPDDCPEGQTCNLALQICE